MHWAAYEGHLETGRTLLAAGADPAAVDKVRGEGKGGAALRSARLPHDAWGRGVAVGPQ